MSEYNNLPDELFKELCEFYIKYINVKQNKSNTDVLPGQDSNKFNVIFDQINTVLTNAFADTLTKKPYTCKGYQTRYKEFFDAELSKINKMSTIPQMFNLKKKLIEYMIEVIQKINPEQLPTYSTFSINSEACGSGYQPILVQILDNIKQKIKDNAVTFVYEKINDVAKEEINNTVSVLDREQKLEDIQNYISETLNIPNNELVDQVSSEYIINELSKKYNDFLSISEIANFNQEIKNKIKKSIVEIVLIESKLKKIYNPKKSLLFSKAIKEFYEK